jgi:hypothetical protein
VGNTPLILCTFGGHSVLKDNNEKAAEEKFEAEVHS